MVAARAAFGLTRGVCSACSTRSLTNHVIVNLDPQDLRVDVRTVAQIKWMFLTYKLYQVISLRLLHCKTFHTKQALVESSREGFGSAKNHYGMR